MDALRSSWRSRRCGDERFPAAEQVKPGPQLRPARFARSPHRERAAYISQEDPMPTRPDDETKKTEKEDAAVPAGADRMPTPEEEAVADAQPDLDADVAESYKEMAERGAKQEGEGRLP
jgi:hypothetical protein